MLFIIEKQHNFFYNTFMADSNSNQYKRPLFISIGVFLWLLGLILIINIWYVAKVLSFIFTYSFGIGSYVIYAIFLVVGFMMIFFQDKLKVKHISRVFAPILLFIGLLILVTCIYTSVGDFGDSITLSGFTSFFASSCYDNLEPSYIRTWDFINLFDVSTPFAGGYFGYLLTALLSPLGGYIVSSLLIVIGILLYFVPNLRKLILKNRSQEEIREDDVDIQDKSLKKEKVKRVRVSNVNVVKEASEQEDEPLPYIPPLSEGVLLKHAYFGQSDYSSRREERNEGVTSADVPFMDKKSLPVISEEKEAKKEQLTLDLGIVEESPLDTKKESIKEPPKEREQIYVDTTPKYESELKPRVEEDIEAIFVPYDDQDFEDYDLEKEKEKLEQVEKLSDFKPTMQETPEVSSLETTPKNELETPAKERVTYIPPSLDLLKRYETSYADEVNVAATEQRAQTIDRKIAEFRTDAHVASYVIGPTVTRFNIEYGQNVSYTRVENLIDDISIGLNGVSCRFVKTVTGTPYSGIEIPNVEKSVVGFRDIFEKLPDPTQHPLAVGFGVNVDGQAIWADYQGFPHAIIAGTTGSGKTVFVESIITTLIMRNSPDDLKIMIVDPKLVDLTKFDGIPHLLCPIVSDYSQVSVAFKKLIDEMNRRYEVFRNARVGGDIKAFNRYAKEHNLERMPYIFVFIDEFADLVGEVKEIANLCQRLAQKSRACGIFLCIATQRPDKNVVTGNLKANLPTHVALRTSNVQDSITIIGEKGANKLLGRGDMLVQTPDINQGDCTRLQGCFLDDEEIYNVVNYLRDNYKTDYDPNFLDLVDHSEEATEEVVKNGAYGSSANFDDDGKYQIIREWVMSQEYVSMSKIQVDFGIGFSRARRIFNQLVQEGIVEQSSVSSNKGSRVLIHEEEEDYEVSSEEALY